MKKCIIYTIILALLLPNIFICAHADNDTQYPNEMNLLFALELADKDYYIAEEYITRAEACSIIYQICFAKNGQSSNFEREFFGDKYESSQKVDISDVNKSENVFSDVDENYEYKNQIEWLYSVGLINGIGNDMFDPNGKIHINQVIKILCIMMGYKKVADYNGGFPTGYLVIDNRLKLSNGVNQDYCTKGDFARILYNAFDKEILKTKFTRDGYTNYTDGTTMLEQYFDICSIKGYVVQNEATGLADESTLAKDQVQIDNLILSTDENTEYIQDYIGRYIKCYYYTENSQKENQMVFAFITDNRVEPVVFDINDFENISRKELAYNNNGRIKKIALSDISYMILNGFYKKEFSEKDFDYEIGDVTVVSSNGSEYDTIIVNGYKTVFTASVDYNEGIIVDLLADEDSKIIDIDLENDIIEIVDSNNEKKQFEDIVANCTLSIAYNAKVYKIIISDEVIESSTIKTIGEKEQKVAITDENGNQYYVCREFVNSGNYKNVAIGNTYTIYLDYFGNISYMQKQSKYNIGYLMKTIDDTNESDNYIVKLKDTSNETQIYPIAKKVTTVYSDEKNDYNKKLTDAGCYETVGNYKGVVRYSVDNEGFLTYIELPMPENFDRENLKVTDRLFILADIDENEKQHYQYKINQATLGGKVFLNKTNTNVFNLNDDNGEVEVQDFIPFENDGRYEFIAYGTNPESIYSENITVKGKAIKVYDENMIPTVVKSIQMGINSDEETVTIVEGVNNGQEVTLYSTEEYDAFNNAVSPIEAANENPRKVSVKSGDIIRYLEDAKGYVTDVQIIYRKSEPRPDTMTGQTGWLFGANQGYDQTNNETKQCGNPYAVRNNMSLSENPWDYGELQRIMYGYVYSFTDEIIEITTQNLEEKDYDEDKEFIPGQSESSTRIHCINGYKLSNCYLVDSTGKNVVVTKATVDDIRSYKEYGHLCSKALVITKYGDMIQMFIIKD